MDSGCRMRGTTLISVLALAIPTGALMSTSCIPGLACTSIGYENGLAVRVDVPGDTAAYRVEVEAEGEILSLAYEVEDKYLPRCVGECRIEGNRIELAEGHIFTELEQLVALVKLRGEDHGPSRARVRVYRADVLVAQGSFEPRYETREPNGRGCGEHVFATASLDAR
jgi:hypothetical protein